MRRVALPGIRQAGNYEESFGTTGIQVRVIGAVRRVARRVCELLRRDETFVEFCQEILLELFGTEWVLVAGVSDYVTFGGGLVRLGFRVRGSRHPAGSGAVQSPASSGSSSTEKTCLHCRKLVARPISVGY